MTGSATAIKISNKKAEELRGQMLSWYDQHRRMIPWRFEKGQKPDPYAIWLSEIMCQQTTVQAVIPYFLKFIARWPRVQDLAAADKEEVMREWAGLGYYARARNLHKCAQVVTHEYQGIFPATKEGLEALPGIGDYTSSAIAAIAYNHSETVVDGNIERIMARLFTIKTPMPSGKKEMKLAAALIFNKAQRPGDFAQSLMDLGATICTPRSPKCGLCPITNFCTAKKTGEQEQLPARIAKKPKPQRRGYVYWIKDGRGNVLLHRRDEKALLGGMLGLPTGEWADKEPEHLDFFNALEMPVSKENIRHVFTHFDLKLDIISFETQGLTTPKGYFWEKASHIEPNDFPTVFKKAVALCLR